MLYKILQRTPAKSGGELSRGVVALKSEIAGNIDDLIAAQVIAPHVESYAPVGGVVWSRETLREIQAIIERFQSPGESPVAAASRIAEAYEKLQRIDPQSVVRLFEMDPENVVTLFDVPPASSASTLSVVNGGAAGDQNPPDTNGGADKPKGRERKPK